MGRGWGEVSEAYATTFAPLCAGSFPALEAALREWAQPRGGLAGSRVLDVGAGTGEWAARLAGLGAHVTAVDPDPGMVELAAAQAPTASVAVAGLPRLPFRDNAFDAVTANFVVNHLRDPRAGVRELTRVTRVGGIVVCSIWPTGQTVQSQLWARVVAESCAIEPPGARLSPELDFSRTEEGLAGLLLEAGLAEVRSTTLEWDLETDPDAIWRGASAGIGGMGQVLLAQDEATRKRMRDTYVRLVDERVGHGSLIMPSRAVVAWGVMR